MPSMFPRRRTDQVYATLQQVQRRISEQGGLPTSVSTPAGMSAPAGRTPASGNLTPGPQPAIRAGPQIPPRDGLPPPPPMLPSGVGAHQRYSVVMSGTLASLLLVCWIASLGAAVLITKQVVKSNPVVSSDQAPRAPLAAAAPATQPKWKLIVLAEMRATPEARSKLAKERDGLNEAMRRNSAKGWQPWFEVEEGVNGSVQLIFAPQGVDKVQWAEFTTLLLRRYAGASWVEIR